MSKDIFDLASFLPFELHQASEAQSQSFAKIYREKYDMTRTEWRVFAHLGEAEMMTATEITQASKLHKTKISRAVFSLEKRGWLIRTTDAEDRRINSLMLSKSGRSVYKELSAEAFAFNKKIEKILGAKEFADGLAVLRRLQQI